MSFACGFGMLSYSHGARVLRRLASRGALSFCLVTFFGGTAYAQESSKTSSDAIESGNYRLDASRSVVRGSTRVIGLAGAYVGIAEGAYGDEHNAASPAQRSMSSFSNLDAGFTADFSLPSWIPGSNYYNGSDSGGNESLGILSFGVNVQ